MPAWTVHYSPWTTSLAVLVGRAIVREAPLSLDGTGATFRGRSLDATDHRLGRWQHPRSGGLGSFVELGGPDGRLRLGCDRLVGDDRYTTAPAVNVDGWLDPHDFEELVAALQAIGRRIRGESDPRFRQVDRGPRTLTLRPNGFRAAWKTPLLIFAALTVVVGLTGLGSLLLGEAALVVGVVAMPLTCWGVALITSRPGAPGALVIEGRELRVDVGDGTSLKLDARYVGVEPGVHVLSGRARFEFPVVALRPPLSEQGITVGTDGGRGAWKAEVEPPAVAAPDWLVGPAEWRQLLETLGLGELAAPNW